MNPYLHVPFSQPAFSGLTFTLIDAHWRIVGGEWGAALDLSVHELKQYAENDQSQIIILSLALSKLDHFFIDDIAKIFCRLIGIVQNDF